MDTPPPLSPPPPPITNTIRSHGSDIYPPTEVPPRGMGKQLKLPLTNGVLTLHHLLPPPDNNYGKCRRNHAIGTGGHTLDGCGEFIPMPTSTPTDLAIQKCVACGCYRSFHRCDVDYFQSQPQLLPQAQSSPPISSSYYPAPPHVFLTLNSSLPQWESTNNNNPTIFAPSGTVAAASGSNQNGKKRSRSKFSQDQKEKMLEFAERIGWKMQKTNKDMIIGFCNEIEVNKDVFKVWMHNHKNISSCKKGNNNHDEMVMQPLLTERLPPLNQTY